MRMVGICINWVALEISSTCQLVKVPQQDEVRREIRPLQINSLFPVLG